MQSCVECGWDTRSGSRICAACRTAKTRAKQEADPNAEKEALLAAVLQSAHNRDPGLADETTTGDIPILEAGPAPDPEPSEDDSSEHVTLREIPGGRAGEESPQGERDAAAADDVAPDEPRHDPSAVSSSLVEAFDDAHSLRKPDTAPDAPKSSEQGSNGTHDIGEDTADDLAALFNSHAPWGSSLDDDETTPPPSSDSDTSPPPPSEIDAALPPPDIEAALPPPDIEAALPPPDIESPPPTRFRDSDTTPSPSYGHDTAEDLAALFNASAPWDTSPPTGSAPAEPDTDYDTLPELYEPAAYTHSTGDIAPPPDASTDVDDPTDRWPTGDLDTGKVENESKNTTYSPAEWPWLGRSGDGGFWAPPADGHETANRNYTGTAAEPSSSPRDNGTSRRDVEEPASTPTPSNSAPSTPAERPPSDPVPERTRAERMRAGFVELGGWTAVAQVALLAAGMLCIIQVFVLIVVSSYLSEARGRGGDVVAGSLAAHAKVDGVMLPALLVFTIVTLAFAVWRSFAGRSNASTPSGILGRPLGIPMALWRVLLAAITLLLVIIPSAPASIGAAQRSTQWAMVACAVLGAACFAAPRGLYASPPATTNDGTGTDADAVATARSRPAA